MPPVLVKYSEYHKYYSQPNEFERRMRRHTVVFKSPMGCFSQTLLTPQGKYVREHLVAFALGKCPNYSGVSKEHVYFKWDLKPELSQKTGLLAAVDWLQDLGYEVIVKESSRVLKYDLVGKRGKAGDKISSIALFIMQETE